MLPGNHPIDGVADLKKHLLTIRRDQFARGFVSKMLIYALGRSLYLDDEILIDELTKNFAKHDYRLAGLMESIVTSKAFFVALIWRNSEIGNKGFVPSRSFRPSAALIELVQ